MSFKFSWKSELEAVLGKKNIIQDEFELKELNSDWT